MTEEQTQALVNVMDEVLSVLNDMAVEFDSFTGAFIDRKPLYDSIQEFVKISNKLQGN